jgi:hypothetical protein
MSMTKFLALLAVVTALLIPGAASAAPAIGTPVSTGVGILNLDVQNDSISASTFTFNGGSVPVDPGLLSTNTDNVNKWVCGLQCTSDLVTQYPGYIRYQQFECARIILALPDNANGDTGWHCATVDTPFTEDSVTGTAAANPASTTVAFDGNGTDNRAPFDPGVSLIPLDLSAYAGLKIDGLVYSNVCSQVYLNADYYPPGGDSGVQNMTGCIGSVDPVTVNAAARSTASASTSASCSGKVCTPTGQATPLPAVRIPGGCIVPRGLAGKTVAKARVALVKHNCRLGKVTRKHSRVKKGGVIKPRMKPGSIHQVNTRVPLLVSRGR